jgi:hypothetical protein
VRFFDSKELQEAAEGAANSAAAAGPSQANNRLKKKASKCVVCVKKKPHAAAGVAAHLPACLPVSRCSSPNHEGRLGVLRCAAAAPGASDKPSLLPPTPVTRGPRATAWCSSSWTSQQTQRARDSWLTSPTGSRREQPQVSRHPRGGDAPTAQHGMAAPVHTAPALPQLSAVLHPPTPTHVLQATNSLRCSAASSSTSSHWEPQTGRSRMPQGSSSAHGRARRPRSWRGACGTAVLRRAATSAAVACARVAVPTHLTPLRTPPLLPLRTCRWDVAKSKPVKEITDIAGFHGNNRFGQSQVVGTVQSSDDAASHVRACSVQKGLLPTLMPPCVLHMCQHRCQRLYRSATPHQAWVWPALGRAGGARPCRCGRDRHHRSSPSTEPCTRTATASEPHAAAGFAGASLMGARSAAT